MTILRWDNHLKIAKYDERTNLPTIYTLESASRYNKYLANYNQNTDDTSAFVVNRSQKHGNKVDFQTNPKKKKLDPIIKLKEIETQNEHSPHMRDTLENHTNVKDRHCPSTNKQSVENEGGMYTRILTQKQILWREWHERLIHMDKETMSNISRQGKIPKILANISPPVCAACQYGKAKKKSLSRHALGSLRNHDNVPGACVSVDQMITTTPGRQITLSGKPTHHAYYCVTVFVDHASGKIFTHYQKNTGAEETLQAKYAFERMSKQHGFILNITMRTM